MISITNLTESVRNTGRHFKTLRGIFPVVQNEEIAFRTGNNYCEVEMSDGARNLILRCYLRRDKDVRERMRDLSPFLSVIDEPVYAGFSFHPEELLVFDDNGGYHYLDVFVEQRAEGISLASLARGVLAKNRDIEPGALFPELAGFAARHARNGVDMGGIGLHNLHWGNGKISLTGFSRASRGSTDNDIAGIALIICIFFLACADSRIISFIPFNLSWPLCEKLAGIFEKCAGETNLPEPVKELCGTLAAIDGGATRERLPVFLDAIEKVSRTKVVRDEGFSGILDKFDVGPSDKGNEVPSKYEYVGPMSCMLMSAYDGKGWCFLDKDGNVAIPGPFKDVRDFWEGLAVVETETGYGVIKRNGEYLVEPEYGDVDIDETGNRIIVTNDGLSGIMSIAGEPVTELIYEGLSSEREGVLIVQQGERFGYITREGKPVTDIIYEEATSFRDGKAEVKLHGRRYLIGTDGKIIEEIICKD